MTVNSVFSSPGSAAMGASHFGATMPPASSICSFRSSASALGKPFLISFGTALTSFIASCTPTPAAADIALSTAVESDFSATTPPASSICLFRSSAAALGKPFLISFGAASTSSIASSNPTPAAARTARSTAIFLATGKDSRMTVKSVFSSTVSAAAATPAAAPGAATLIGAPATALASSTKVSSIVFTSSDASNSVFDLRSSSMSLDSSESSCSPATESISTRWFSRLINLSTGSLTALFVATL